VKKYIDHDILTILKKAVEKNTEAYKQDLKSKKNENPASESSWQPVNRKLQEGKKHPQLKKERRFQYDYNGFYR